MVHPGHMLCLISKMHRKASWANRPRTAPDVSENMVKGSRDKETVRCGIKKDQGIKSCYNMNTGKPQKAWNNLDMRNMAEGGRVWQCGSARQWTSTERP